MDTSKIYIKRVIGLPGDRIEIRSGPMPEHEDPPFDRDRFLPQSPLE
jgi:signal peptidase I